jgi:acetoacetyl-CoA reductase/3-oxoacyl-[acyl-carrier protein] reductase
MSGMAEPNQLVCLCGKLALVTGGNGDVGREIVQHLLRAGASVVSVDLPGTDPAHEGVDNKACDLRDLAAIERLVDDVTAGNRAVDVFVHCAGITRDGVLWKMSKDDWTEVMKVNLDSAFHLLQALAPSMRTAGGGTVVLVSSINGQRGKFGQANYAASKAGLIGLGKTAARELGPSGIRVNMVAPGLIETKMTADLPAEIKQRAIDETALGRTGTPADVARTVLYLCTDMSSHVTGQVVRVDGGQCTA